MNRKVKRSSRLRMESRRKRKKSESAADVLIGTKLIPNRAKLRFLRLLKRRSKSLSARQEAILKRQEKQKKARRVLRSIRKETKRLMLDSR